MASADSAPDVSARVAGWRHERPEGDLQRYLQGGREALLWKLDGLSEYDVRRPLTPTGTNLLGLVKHVASVELGYFGDTFGRPSGEPLPWLDEDAEPNADMWATADETREEIVGLYRRAWAHSDATIDALALDADRPRAVVAAGAARSRCTAILVHMIAETDRHAGHADIVRELDRRRRPVCGAGGDNLPETDRTGGSAYRERRGGRRPPPGSAERARVGRRGSFFRRPPAPEPARCGGRRWRGRRGAAHRRRRRGRRRCTAGSSPARGGC